MRFHVAGDVATVEKIGRLAGDGPHRQVNAVVARGSAAMRRQNSGRTDAKAGKPTTGPRLEYRCFGDLWRSLEQLAADTKSFRFSVVDGGYHEAMNCPFFWHASEAWYWAVELALLARVGAGPKSDSHFQVLRRCGPAELPLQPSRQYPDGRSPPHVIMARRKGNNRHIWAMCRRHCLGDCLGIRHRDTWLRGAGDHFRLRAGVGGLGRSPTYG